MELENAHKQEMMRLKSYFPYRIVFAAVSPCGNVEIGSSVTMRRPNDFSRKGYSVFVLS